MLRSIVTTLDDVLKAARTLEQQGARGQAISALDAVPEAQRSGAWHYARGAMAVREGALDAALPLLEQAVKLEPEISEYRSNLGAALLELVKAGRAELAGRALEQLELAVQWGASLPDVFANLSFARLATGDANGALMAADVGLRMDPLHLASHYNRAAALSAMKQWGACLSTLDELLRIAPGFPPAVESRANTLKKLGRV